MELALLAMVVALVGVFVGFAVDLGMALVVSVFLGTAGLAWEVWGFAEFALLVVVMGFSGAVVEDVLAAVAAGFLVPVVTGFFGIVVERFLGVAADVDFASLGLLESSVGVFAVIVVSKLLA
jgi:hypothetical protein